MRQTKTVLFELA